MTDKDQFRGLFSRIISVGWHQKGSTNLDSNEGRDDGVAVASAERYANHLHLANHASTSSLNILQARCSS